jgi:hypothetical protein
MPFQFISQRPIERLDTFQLDQGQSGVNAYFECRTPIVHIRLQAAMKAEIQLVLEVLHVDAAAGYVTSTMQRGASSS